MDTKYDIWIDISNTPQVFFFNSLVDVLKEDHSVLITSRERGETSDLLEMFDVKHKSFGRDFRNPILKTASLGFRSLQLTYKIPDFGISFSFENPMPVPTNILRKKNFVLFLDNDLKVISEKSGVQGLETRIQKFADFLIVPETSKEVFSDVFEDSTIFQYPGYKEHIYISDFKPDPCDLPFEEYVVLRPESLSSLYVLYNESLIPKILDLMKKENINVVYLPREKEDEKFASDFENVYVPDEALNGLDLCYNAKAVLTGSGTMAREAAVLGTPAVSFFPRDRLLAVDQDLVDRGKMLHSRDPREIIDHVVSKWDDQGEPEYERAGKAKEEVVGIIDEIVDEQLNNH